MMVSLMHKCLESLMSEVFCCRVEGLKVYNQASL